MAVLLRLIATAAALLLSACGGGGAGDDASGDAASTPYLTADGPLHSLVIAAGVEQTGRVRDPRPGFTSEETEVNALVTLGEGADVGSKLVVAWFQVAATGRRTRLFSHELVVSSGTRARSQGIARSGLAPGTYVTEATLGRRRVSTPWVVNTGVRTLSAAAAAGEAPAPPEQGLAEVDDWGGWDTPYRGPPLDGPCSLEASSLVELDELAASADWIGRCSTVIVAAGVAGTPSTLVREDVVVEEGIGDVSASPVEICELPGGSDFPGTVVEVVASDSGGASSTDGDTLTDAGETLAVGIDSAPPSGSRVEAGATITLRASAIVFAPALGVRSLRLQASHAEIAATTNDANLNRPRPCEPRRLVAHLGTSARPIRFRVPADPSPTLEICATAAGFDGTEARSCATFYTGEIWKGTWDAGFHVIGSCTPPVWPQVGTLHATVAVDGSLSGRGDLVNHTGVCGGTDRPQQVPVAPLFTGRRTDEEIRLEIELPGLGSRTIRMPRNGDVAEGSATIPLGGGSRWEIRARLECTTC